MEFMSIRTFLLIVVCSFFSKTNAAPNDFVIASQGNLYSIYWPNKSMQLMLKQTLKIDPSVSFEIAASMGANGNISPSGIVIVDSGNSQTYFITPDSCFQIADVLIDGISQGAIGSYTFSNVTEPHTISATFTPLLFTIAAAATSNGSITTNADSIVTCGNSQTYFIIAASCYQIADVVVDGISQGAIGSYTFSNVTEPHTINATFTPLLFTIATAATSNGSITTNADSVVTCGNSQTYFITAASCYQIADVLIDGISQGAIGSYTFSNVIAPHTISAIFTPLLFTIAAAATSNGTITTNADSIVTCGNSQTYLITAASCYQIADVLIDGISQGAISSYAFSNVIGPHTISATFTPLLFTIAAAATSNGTITTNADSIVTCGNSQTYLITAASCYQIADVLIDGISQGAISSYAFSNVIGPHTISATFTPLLFTIAAAATSNGTITTNADSIVTCGNSQTYFITAASCYQIADVLIDGISQGAISSYTFSNVTEPHTINATFTPLLFTISAAVTSNGSITTNADSIVECGNSRTYFITPNTNYKIKDVFVDGVSQGPVTGFTFSNIIVAHTISATFKPIPKHNVILIIADDLGTDYCGFYENHLDTASLPNLRKLLSKGVRFTNAMTNPLCSPTRAGIFTGRYSFRTGVGSSVGYGTGDPIDTAEITIPKMLKKFSSSLASAQFGKWHLSLDSPSTNLVIPNIMGYDYYSGNFRALVQNYYSWPKITNGILQVSNTYVTTETANSAIQWIKTQDTVPFFLWLAFNAPHEPWHLPPAGLYSDSTLSGLPEDINLNPKKYYKAALEAMDHEIGRLFDSLQTFNMLDSTDFIFIGDNGNPTVIAQLPIDSTRSKGTIYQGGIEVPLIISGPSVVNPGRTSSALVNSQDLFATILELFGYTTWKSQIPLNKPVDSKSIMPILKGTSSSIRTWAFTELFNAKAAYSDGKTIRNKNYKFLKFDNGAKALYSLNSDPKELHNLLDTLISDSTLFNYFSLCNQLAVLTKDTSSCSPAIFINPVITNVNCYGQANGAIQLRINGANPPFTCLWNNGSQSKNRTGLNPGVYTVIVTDSLLNKMQLAIEVKGPQKLTFTTTLTKPTCSSNIGSINVLVKGGKSPYKYLWNTGNTNASLANLGSGIYTLTITDKNNCTAKATANLNITGTAPTSPTVMTGSFTNVCAGTLNANYSILPVSKAISYLWTSPVNSLIANGQGSTAIKLNFNGSFTTGTLSVSAKNNCGTSAALIKNIGSVPGVPSAIIGPVTVCANQNNVAYSILPVAGATSYTWVKPTGTTLTSGQGTTNITVGFKTTAGAIKVRANNTCGSSANVSLNVAIACRELAEGFISDFNIYPNPADNILNISFYTGTETKFKITITDALGRNVFSKSFYALEDFNKTSIDVSNFTKGIYFLNFEMNGLNKVVKVALN